MPRRTPPRPCGEHRDGASSAREAGFALLIVLWTMVLLALLVTELTSAGRTEAQLAHNLRLGAALQDAADAALYEGIFGLIDAGPHRIPADGLVHAMRVDGLPAAIRIEPLDGRVNPNIAPPELLEGLLGAVGADPRTASRIAAAIIDWRSPAADPRPDAAKEPAYRAAGLPYAPPGAPFQSLNEIGMVLGMTPELLARLAPHLSLYNPSDPVLADADPVVARVLQGNAAAPSVGAAPATPPSQETVAEITASVAGPGGTRATRRAVVHIGQAIDGRDWHILAWDPPAR